MLRVAEQYSGTDTGRQRRANEDSLFARVPLFVVADGMGGAQAGEVASRTAVEVFRPGLDDDAGNDPEGSLTARALAANSRIHELSQQNPDQAGMGTTLTAVYVGEREVSIAHVGDSRAYCLRGEELERLTDDHSLVDELMRQGKLTAEEAEEHPQRSIITRALGPEPTVEVDTRTYRAWPGDIYLLCSDGLTTMLSEAEIAAVMLSEERLRDMGEALLAAANEAGGRDNITVILFRLEDVGGEGHRGSEHQHRTRSDWQADDEGPFGSAVQTLQSKLSEPLADELPQTQIPSHEPPPKVPALKPRRAGSEPAAHTKKNKHRFRFPLALLIVLGLIVAAVYLTSQSIYFIATNKRGFVTIYSGLPYTLPGKLNLYSQYYVSGVPASSVRPSRRRTLLNHSLRSESDAAQLVRGLELGQVSG